MTSTESAGMKIIIINTEKISAHATSYHCHDYWQIDHYFETPIKVKVCVEGKTSLLDDSLAVIIPPGFKHSFENFVPCKLNACKFMPEHHLDIITRLKPGIIEIANYSDIFDAVFSADVNNTPVEEEIRKHYLYLLLLRYSRECDGGNISHGYDSRINEVICYIKTNLTTGDLSLKKLAAIANVSENHFIRLFQHETSITPIQYVRLLLAKKATNLLTHSSMSLREIALALRFPDPHSFSRSFKQVTGVPPGYCRRHNREPL